MDCLISRLSMRRMNFAIAFVIAIFAMPHCGFAQSGAAPPAHNAAPYYNPEFGYYIYWTSLNGNMPNGIVAAKLSTQAGAQFVNDPNSSNAAFVTVTVGDLSVSQDTIARMQALLETGHIVIVDSDGSPDAEIQVADMTFKIADAGFRSAAVALYQSQSGGAIHVEPISRQTVASFVDRMTASKPRFIKE